MYNIFRILLFTYMYTYIYIYINTSLYILVPSIQNSCLTWIYLEFKTRVWLGNLVTL